MAILKRRPGLFAAVAVAVAAVTAVSLAQGPATAPLPEIAVPKGAILKRDGENYFAGPYIGYAADWAVTTGKVRLRKNIDYRDGLVIRPERFPADTELHWHWPSGRSASGVYGYVHIAYGYYAGGKPKQAIPARQVSQIRAMSVGYAVAPGPVRGDYNLLAETFLTSAPGDFKTRSLEVGFLPKVSASGQVFFDKSEQLGVWTDPSGRRWRVAINKAYCMFVPETGPVWRARVDFAAAFRWLVARHKLTGREWFNGVAIGVEPVGGSGRLTVRRWIVTYR